MGYLVVVHACVPPTQALNFLYIIYFLPIFFALDENAGNDGSRGRQWQGLARFGLHNKYVFLRHY